MTQPEKHLPIKSWSEDDRPREKLMKNGQKSLANSELMALLIRSGRKGESAISICKKVLSDHGNNLHKISRLSVKELMKYKGIGEAKAITLVAALELGLRSKFALEEESTMVKSSKDAFQYMAPSLQNLPFEEFHVLILNQGNRIIKSAKVSSGGVSATVVDPRMVIKPAIESLASHIILVHNHPSGVLKPSQEDKNLTAKLVQAAQFFNIKVLDHIIISDGGYFSFSDEGLI